MKHEPRSILVVDDDIAVRQIFSAILRTEGYQVWEGATGRQGLELAREKRPDLVLLDVRLPDLNGMEVCRQIKSDENLRDIFVILCSGAATSSADKVIGLGTGADEYIAKPVNTNELLARVRMLMRLQDTIAALRGSQEHHSRLIEILPDAVCLINREGKLLAVNAQAVAMFGYANPSELVGKNTFDLTAKEDYERIKTDIANTLKTGFIRNAEYTLLKKDQVPFHVELNATLSPSGNGQPIGMVSVMRDVTERKQAEQRIRQLLDLLDQAHDAIIVRDLNGRIQYFNKGAERVLGWTSDEVQGQHATELFFKNSSSFAATQEKLRQTGEWNGETHALTKNGQPIIFHSRWTLTRKRQGQDPYVVSINTDVTQRKLVEALLKEQEELSQRIIGTAIEGFWRLDVQGRLLDVNEAYCRMTGYSREELLSMRISDVEVNDSSPELVTEHIQRILKSGSDRFESRHRRKDGLIFEVEIIATVLKLREHYIFAFVRDITERKRAEKVLRESEERFRQLADNIREVFWMTDVAKRKIIYVSPAYEEIWGRTCGSLYASPENYVEAIHPDDCERVLESALTRQISGQYNEVYRIVRPDGSIRWIQDRAFPIRDDSGKVYRIVGIAEDITRRKQAWDALGESEARKSAIMRVALDGIITIDHAGRIMELNSAAEKMFAHNRIKLTGEKIMDIIPPSLRPWFQDGLANCFGGDKGPIIGSRIEMPALRTDGSQFPAEFTITQIKHEGQPTFAVYIRDITQRKRAEEELRSLPQRIIEAQESERLRVARELHDGINQLIASVKMRLGKVSENLPDLKPAAREVLVRCDRLLVKALEENRRIAHNLHPTDLDNLGLAAACRNLCQEFELRTNLKVQCRIASIGKRLPPNMALNLFRIVQEAVNNIEKYARAKTVKLKIGLQENVILLKIQDDGCGFNPRKSKADKKKWHGLGLTNMRERALSLGGTCEVLSAPKKGTTVTVRIPRAGAK
ncbi:MAG: PAS domain S-box protein [Limisphaerales bacterium]